MGKGIIVILIANILNMVFGLATGFILPKYLSVETYAIIKTFQLYLSFVGLFHMGYADGMYLRYGGKNLKDLNKKSLKTTIFTMNIFQMIVSIVMVIASIKLNKLLLILFSLDIFGYNMVDFYKRMYQAIGQFKSYSRVINIVTALNFVSNMMLLLIIKSDNAYLYVLGYVIVDYFMLFVLTIKFSKIFNSIKICIFEFNELISNIKEGILLLFGNFSSIILTSMDRWFTKILLTTIDFAQYSFAVSIENFLNIAITPVTITFYNYLCRIQSKTRIIQLRNYINIFSACLMTSFFPVKFILEIYLDKYYQSLNVITFLFASQFFYIIIKSIYVNLYKSRLQQRRYFIQVVIVIIVGFILNVLLYKITPCKESFSVGTFISAMIWYLICILDVKDIRPLAKELLFVIFEVCIFIVSAFIFNSIIGFVVYIITTLIMIFILMRETAIIMLNFIFESIKNKGWKR